MSAFGDEVWSMATATPNDPASTGWAPRLGRWNIRLALAALLVPAIGLTLARNDVIGKLPGFSTLLAGGLMAVLALLLGIAALIAGRKQAFAGKRTVIAATVFALVFVGFFASRPLTAGNAPLLHDITTDLANPPQFEVLPLRADNLTGVGTIENWRQIHAAAYPQLGPITLAKPVAAVTADAVRLAEKTGWQVAASRPGHVEATASVSYIRFQDDVVIRIEPIGDGNQSRVDIRSVSRVGGGDLGVNARRIRDFLEQLAAL
jgi:hypothetical protein